MHLIYRLIALLAFVASMLGCNQPQRSFTQRTTANGVDLLDSQVEILATRARFDCRASQSGDCHYTVFAHACAGGGDCSEPPLRQLTVATGTVLDITGLPTSMQVCARTDAAPVDARCRPRAPSS